jgi:hypothetical protein
MRTIAYKPDDLETKILSLAKLHLKKYDMETAILLIYNKYYDGNELQLTNNIFKFFSRRIIRLLEKVPNYKFDLETIIIDRFDNPAIKIFQKDKPNASIEELTFYVLLFEIQNLKTRDSAERFGVPNNIYIDFKPITEL